MSNQRKQIILNEIAFWKQSKFLPDHYCDFLTTLYTEGQQHEQLNGVSNESMLAKEKSKKKWITFGLPIATLLLVVLLFATEIQWLVIGVVGAVAVIALVVAIILAKKNNVFAPIVNLCAALLILGVSLKLCVAYFEGNNTVLYSMLVGNCLLWLITGLLTRAIYFTISGALGLFVMVGAYFYFM